MKFEKYIQIYPPALQVVHSQLIDCIVIRTFMDNLDKNVSIFNIVFINYLLDRRWKVSGFYIFG